MTENEDDDSFGEFTFASNIPTTTASNDDVWGDFNFYKNDNSTTITTDHNRQSPETELKWKKINGALPLSLFGGDDDDVEDDHDVNPVVHVAGVNNYNKSDGSKLGINDLIANLYGQKEENVKAVENGKELEFTAVNLSVSKCGSEDEEDGWEFIDANSHSKISKNVKENTESTEKTVSPPGIQNGSYEPIDLFAAVPSNGGFVGSHVMDNGFDSKPTTSFQNGFMVDFKAEDGGTTNDLSSNLLDGDDDFDDTFGDFETAVMEQASEKKELSQDCYNPLSSHDASHGSVDLFAFSNGVPDGSHKENNGFDFSQSSVGQNGVASDPLSSYNASHGSVDLFAFSNEVPDASHKNNGFDFNQSSVGQNGVASDPFSSHDASHSSVDLYAFSNGVPDGSHKENNGFDFSQSSVGQNGVASDPLSSHAASHGSVDLFAFSNGVPDGSHKQNNGFDFSQSSVGQNGVASDPFSQTEWNETKDELNSKLPGGDDDDEDFGKFETAFAEAGSKPEESEASLKNYKEPVPLSIFGLEEEPETDNSFNLQHELFKSSSQAKHTQNQSSNLSINDILSDLYRQAEPISSAYHEHNPDEKVNSLHSTSKEYASHVGDDDDDDDFDEGSWEFKDASIHSSAEKQNLSFEKKLSNCMDLYSKLKDELCVVARHHLHSLKKAQSIATQVGDEMKGASLNKEMQEALEKLHQKDIISTEFDFGDHSVRNISFKEYIESLLAPDFQVLESEYHISRRLSLAESDLQTVIDLINHFTALLKILTLAPKGEPADFVSLWLKVISVCSQELKHGTWIWKQSLEKNVHGEILSEPQGKQYIIALGELYRTVVILGAAVKFYKPWILLSGPDLGEICGLLDECHSLWSTSGLEDAIPAESLLQSIRNIQNLDEFAIANELLSEEESQCRLSLLSSGVVPEMRMVIWNGDKYFAALANLWANLISPDPPKKSIHSG